jgi:ketopantoate hydroxymethyltransferase
MCKDSLSKTVTEIVEETVVTVYDMFKHKDYFNKGNDTSAMLIDLKFAIIAKRSHEDPLELLKVKVEQFIKNKHSGKSDNARRVLRTGVIIFIAIKAFIE